MVTWKPEVIEVAPPPVSTELKKRWTHFIRKVYETDPRTCPKCQGEMRIIGFIHQEDSHTIFPFKLLSNLLHSPQSKNQDGNNYEYKRIETYFQKIGERDHPSISQFHKFLF